MRSQGGGVVRPAPLEEEEQEEEGETIGEYKTVQMV